MPTNRESSPKSRGKDENRPRRKKEIDEDEEEEELGAYGRLKKNIWVRGGVLTVLVGTMAVLGWMLYKKRSTSSSEPEEREVASGTNNQQSMPKAVIPFKNPPKNPPPPVAKDPETLRNEELFRNISGVWTYTSLTPDGMPRYTATLTIGLDENRQKYSLKHTIQPNVKLGATGNFDREGGVSVQKSSSPQKGRILMFVDGTGGQSKFLVDVELKDKDTLVYTGVWADSNDPTIEFKRKGTETPGKTPDPARRQRFR